MDPNTKDNPDPEQQIPTKDEVQRRMEEAAHNAMVQALAAKFALRIPPEDVADSGLANPNWRPYCLKCSEIRRMLRQPYGFQCRGCGNRINRECKPLDSK